VFEIGNSLHEARTRRKIELVQAEQATKIRGKYLKALEDEEFDLLPSETYVKGFLRAYADYLGLDGQLYVDEYNSRFVAGDDWQPRRSRAAEEGRRRERRVQAVVVLVTLAVVAILTTIVISAWQTSGGSGGTKTPTHATRTKAAVHGRTTAGGYLEITAVRGASKVIVNRATAKGRTLFEGTLDRGETRAFTGATFWLNVGAPENLDIRVAGRRVHVAGYRPWVLTVTPSGWHGHPA
jgi:cytoskeletal protein RodZ